MVAGRRIRSLSAGALVLAIAWVGIGVPTLAGDRPAATRAACTVVDTDAGLDDFRALAVLAPARDIRAVVATEGISGVQNGATAVSMFLASHGATPPVVPGLASPNPPAYDWLPAARAGAERIDDYLHDAVPFGRDPGRLTRDLRAAVRGCDRVDLLVLGPWTSYLRYSSVLGHDVHVVASGRSFAENNPDNFNCEYDLAACRTATGRLHRAVFVDLPPAGPEPTYDPTAEMIAGLEAAGMPGLLRTALRVDPGQWLGTRLWDDAAALYLVETGVFAPRGGHVEPAVPSDEFRDLVRDAINAG
ncbi:MAG TPA: hypothetical protein VH969_26895 [Actinophytocola sp.]|jgi:hypothetical protein|uniref:hypothetical protein n=1 Tax=Actinophytocola sp. TaxID=1872138 RepID=UPI002F94796E